VSRASLCRGVALPTGTGPDGSLPPGPGQRYASPGRLDRGFTLSLARPPANATVPTPPELIHVHFAVSTATPPPCTPATSNWVPSSTFRAGRAPRLSLTDVPNGFVGGAGVCPPWLSMVYHGPRPTCSSDFHVRPGPDPPPWRCPMTGVIGHGRRLRVSCGCTNAPAATTWWVQAHPAPESRRWPPPGSGVGYAVHARAMFATVESAYEPGLLTDAPSDGIGPKDQRYDLIGRQEICETKREAVLPFPEEKMGEPPLGGRAQIV